MPVKSKSRDLRRPIGMGPLVQGLLTVASTPLNHDILDDRTPIPDPCIRTSPIISKPSSGQHKRGENVAAVPHTRRDAFRSREDMSHRENAIVRMGGARFLGLVVDCVRWVQDIPLRVQSCGGKPDEYRGCCIPKEGSLGATLPRIGGGWPRIVNARARPCGN